MPWGGSEPIALKLNNFGRDPIDLDQARGVQHAIVAGRRPPLTRAQVAFTSYKLHYARLWANQAVEAAFLQSRAVTPQQQQLMSSAEQGAAEARNSLLQDAESALLPTSRFWTDVQETAPSSPSGEPRYRSVSSNDEEGSEQAGLPQMLQAVGRNYAEGLKIQQERWRPERQRGRPASRSRTRGRRHRGSKARHAHRSDRRHRSRHRSRGWSRSVPPHGRRRSPDYSPLPPRSRRRRSPSLSPCPLRKRRRSPTYSPLPPRRGRWVPHDSPDSLNIGPDTHSGATKRNSRSRGRHQHGGGGGRSQTATSRKHAHHRKRGSLRQRSPTRHDNGYLPTTVVQPEVSAVCSPTQRTAAAAGSPSRPPQPDQAPAFSCTGVKPSKTAAQQHRTSAERHQPRLKLYLTNEASSTSLGAGMSKACSVVTTVAATEAATGMAATEVATPEAAATEICPTCTEVAASETAAAMETVPAATEVVTEAATGE